MRRRRALSEEDRALWSRVAATAQPLRREREPRAPEAEEPVSSALVTRGPAPRRSAETRAPDPTPPHSAPTSVMRPLGRAEPAASWTPPRDGRPRPPDPSTPGLDRGTARRLGRGRIEPQARLDMHGLTADRAHAALTRFIHAGAAQGLRCVLVVTGKGAGAHGGRGDGLLRRETPRWLEVAPLSRHVVGVFEAHAKHGGGGALYVYLKRDRRS